jgi:hypothetical protein
LQHIEPILINGQAVKVVEVRTPDGAAEGAKVELLEMLDFGLFFPVV